MNKYCKVNSNVVQGTTNCTWYVTKRGCKLLKNWLKNKYLNNILIF